MDKDLLVALLVVLAFFVLVALVATVGEGLYEAPSAVVIKDVDVAAAAINASTAALNITAYLDNWGTSSGNIKLFVKAFDARTNLLVATNRTDVGILKKEETKAASVLICVERHGDYRIRLVLIEDEKSIGDYEVYIRGLEALEPPEHARLSLRAMDFYVESVESVGGKEYAAINVTLYIDNLGSDVSGLRALVKARDNETKLITARQWLDLGLLPKESTSLRHATLHLLNGRDYVVETQIWQEQQIIKEGSGFVALSPFANRTIAVRAEEETMEVSPAVEISYFIPSQQQSRIEPLKAPRDVGGGERHPTPPMPAGFEGVTAVGSLLAALFLLKGVMGRGK
ncbi:MAG: hypothetical protein OD815_001126 [Candidatus Alkanophagales archaeon MCA70_species_2]|nr:hypothetical protein [Candidatus Alkanophaga liquidiphilum]RLG38106.1 MAG: hypothetical protein DRN91_03595 [Candidatus Alkanophagales archaeon]